MSRALLQDTSLLPDLILQGWSVINGRLGSPRRDERSCVQFLHLRHSDNRRLKFAHPPVPLAAGPHQSSEPSINGHNNFPVQSFQSRSRRRQGKIVRSSSSPNESLPLFGDD
ncbi:unnamed protein product [Cuscuta europaea]|uniref:Uncharacterized protein n=1 Tax=Cuscuta europaea TaxID=41803 RepID=A0A9P0ZYB7_CUSEU|nr:unnamed protein product [Cuscuta europaea]